MRSPTEFMNLIVLIAGTHSLPHVADKDNSFHSRTTHLPIAVGLH